MTDGHQRLAIIDDHPLLRIGLAAQLGAVGLAAEIPELLPPGQLVDWIGRRSLACVVLDLGLPVQGGGLALIEPVVATGTPVVVLTGETDRGLWVACLAAGAKVVLSKSDPMEGIVGVIRKVCSGEPVKPVQWSALWDASRRLVRERDQRLAPFRALSPREKEVLLALIEGHGPAEIAARDFVSIQTVRTQIKAVLRKLAVRSQLEAVARANASGWRGDEAGGSIPHQVAPSWHDWDRPG